MHAAALQPHEMPSDIRWMQSVTQLLGWLLLALVVAVGLTWVSRQPFFQIRQVRIEGELQRNNLPTVRANALPRIHGDYFSVMGLGLRRLVALLAEVGLRYDYALGVVRA